MDIVSRERYPKERLFRFVVREGIVTLDDASGRGFYLLASPSSIETFFRKKPYLRFGKILDEASMKEELLKRVNANG